MRCKRIPGPEELTYFSIRKADGAGRVKESLLVETFLPEWICKASCKERKEGTPRGGGNVCKTVSKVDPSEMSEQSKMIWCKVVAN